MGFNLRNHTHLVVVSGSRAYGLHTDASDVDIKGVAIPPVAYYTGFLCHFEQADGPNEMGVFRDLLTAEEMAADLRLEGVVYELRKFIAMAVDCNPNILDVLFCRDEEVRFRSWVGVRLREERMRFLSARARYSFSGFAHAQMKKIRNARESGHSSKGDAQVNKHAVHLVRLLRMCREILTEGAVKVWRDDAEELRKIRAGAWHYDELLAWAAEEDAALTEIYKSGAYAVPKEPDREWLDAFCVRLLKMHF